MPYLTKRCNFCESLYDDYSDHMLKCQAPDSERDLMIGRMSNKALINLAKSVIRFDRNQRSIGGVRVNPLLRTLVARIENITGTIEDRGDGLFFYTMIGEKISLEPFEKFKWKMFGIAPNHLRVLN